MSVPKDPDAISRNAGHHVTSTAGNDSQFQFDILMTQPDTPRGAPQAGWGMMPPRSSSGVSSEFGCAGGGVLSDFFAS